MCLFRAFVVINSTQHAKLFLLSKQGLWTCFFPLYKDVLKRLQCKEIGDVQFVTIAFGFGGMLQIERVSNPELGGGAMLDLGLYPLVVTDMIFGGEEPERVTAVGHKTATGVDETVSVTMLYSGNRMSQILVTIGKPSPTILLRNINLLNYHLNYK